MVKIGKKGNCFMFLEDRKRKKKERKRRGKEGKKGEEEGQKESFGV